MFQAFINQSDSCKIHDCIRAGICVSMTFDLFHHYFPGYNNGKFKHSLWGNYCIIRNKTLLYKLTTHISTGIPNSFANNTDQFHLEYKYYLLPFQQKCKN